MLCKKTGNNKGITYIEIILAVTIVTFVIMGFARMFLIHNVSVTSSRMHTLASNYAAHRMEEIKSYPYVLVSTTTFTTESEIFGGTKEFISDINIVEIKEGLKEAEVIVRWDELGEPRSFRIVSLIAEY